MTYNKFVGSAETAWDAIELAASGMQLSPDLASAMAAAKSAYFYPGFLALRDRLMNAVVNGEKQPEAALADMDKAVHQIMQDAGYYS